MKTKIEIPFRLPSLNQYINECRRNRFAGAKMKKEVENDIGWCINQLPEYNKPIKIHFHWIEENKKRNLIIYSIPVTCDKIIFLGITVLYFFKNYSSIRISKFYKSENYEINDGLF